MYNIHILECMYLFHQIVQIVDDLGGSKYHLSSSEGNKKVEES